MSCQVTTLIPRILFLLACLLLCANVNADIDGSVNCFDELCLFEGTATIGELDDEFVYLISVEWNSTTQTFAASATFNGVTLVSEIPDIPLANIANGIELAGDPGVDGVTLCSLSLLPETSVVECPKSGGLFFEMAFVSLMCSLDPYGTIYESSDAISADFDCKLDRVKNLKSVNKKVTYDSFKIKWDPTDLGIEEGYKVQMKKTSESSWETVQNKDVGTDGSSMEYAPDGLDMGTEYKVRVKARSSQVQNSSWKSITETTLAF